MVADEQLSKLIDAISCPICKCCIVDPYVLPCNHYYCRLVYTAIISIHLYCFQKVKHVVFADNVWKTPSRRFKKHVFCVVATVRVEI